MLKILKKLKNILKRPIMVVAYKFQTINLHYQIWAPQVVSHWVPLSYGLVPHLSKKLSKLPPQVV